jgi:hypothetical protein
LQQARAQPAMLHRARKHRKSLSVFKRNPLTFNFCSSCRLLESPALAVGYSCQCYSHTALACADHPRPNFQNHYTNDGFFKLGTVTI